MADVQAQPVERKERNAYLSSPRVKETTFREWVVANQIGRFKATSTETEGSIDANPNRNLLDHPGYVAGSA